MTTETPATTQAIVVVAKGQAEIQEIPVPKVYGDWILVKVKAVGLNPADWKSIQGVWTDAGTRVGCDYAGEVVEVGPQVTKDFKKGDRIAGWTHGGNRLRRECGAFGGYALVKQHVQMKIPDNITDEEAATFGISITTVGQGLYSPQGLSLPPPTAPSPTPLPVFIYGGATATGIYGVQFAKASGLRVAAACSPRHFELVRGLGADAVFDYADPARCAAGVRAFAGGRLRAAWDCTGQGVEICAEALRWDDDDDYVGEKKEEEKGEEGEQPTYGTIVAMTEEPLRKANPRVRGPRYTLGYDAIGEDYVTWCGEVKADAERRDFADWFWGVSERLLRDGTVRPLRPEVNRWGAGLEGVLKGLEDLKAGKVRGTKLVYTL
ncbi:GroES-like protein [Biscogniauxia mediterranea]|nr:GroES-like protein [Biscogniauxia mediterranea]